MTTKPLTPRQEAFCRAMLTAKDQAQAYRVSFTAKNMKPATVYSKASILMADGKIQARIAELRAPVVAKVQYGLEEAMAEAAEAFEVARDKAQGGAMVAAVQLRAKLNGLLVDKREDVTDPLMKAMANMPAEQAQQMLDALEQLKTIQKKAKDAA